MIKKLIKAVEKRNKKANKICDEFDKLQAKAFKNLNS